MDTASAAETGAISVDYAEALAETLALIWLSFAVASGAGLAELMLLAQVRPKRARALLSRVSAEHSTT
ncbi:hypothetical protein [Litoreibacter janthinus]|uniref:hypothetical protein n=1 Tax=Litoreibacter janthinus TaxID=670154 RepID=UPI000B7E949F|nr:hypothetical protein [Litoreibacter janthinus]